MLRQLGLCIVTKDMNPKLSAVHNPPAGHITLAASVCGADFSQRAAWLADNDFAMAYTPDAENLFQTRDHLTPYLKNKIPVRHHAYFPGFEIGDKDAVKAEQAVKLHMQALDAMKGWGEPVMTVHVGLPPQIPLDHGRVVDNLSRLVSRAKSLGITLCLENLRMGPTSNPETVLEWAGQSGAAVTMDIGHAVSCDRVVNGELEVPEIVKMFSPLLEEVHFYESETDTHHAPKDMSVLGPVVDQLLQTRCQWWTIELETPMDLLHTRKLIQDYFVAGAFFLAS